MERRISSTVGTIPNYTALAGTVTSQTDATVLLYSGSNDVGVQFRDGALGLDSSFWIYVPSGTPKIAKVIGTYKRANNSWSIQLDRAITGAASASCNFVKAAISFSYVNDGDADATVNGVTIKPGDSNSYLPYEKYSNRVKLQPVAYVDATNTSILINEEI